MERQRELVPNQLSITVGEMPVLLSGDLGGVTIAQVRQHAFPRADSPQRGRLQLPRFFGEAVQMGQPVTQASFHNYKKLTAPDYGGPEDLSAAFEASYDRDNLYLTIRVTDNVFNQSETNIVNAWRGDSIQVAFQTADPDGIASRTELDAALINGKAEILVREAQGDSGTQPECKIEQQGNVTTYHLKLPASLLGQKAFEPGGMLACSFLVNDNDGTGRKGFITWGEGIGIGKNPSLYNLLTLR